MSLMSVNWPHRVTSQFLAGPSISTINSSTNPSLSGYFSRRCCLQMSAVCFCRFLVPRPIVDLKLAVVNDCRDVSPLFRWQAYYRRPYLSRHGNTAEGIPRIEQGIKDFRKTGSVLGLPNHLALRG